MHAFARPCPHLSSDAVEASQLLVEEGRQQVALEAVNCARKRRRCKQWEAGGTHEVSQSRLRRVTHSALTPSDTAGLAAWMPLPAPHPLTVDEALPHEHAVLPHLQALARHELRDEARHGLQPVVRRLNHRSAGWHRQAQRLQVVLRSTQ